MCPAELLTPPQVTLLMPHPPSIASWLANALALEGGSRVLRNTDGSIFHLGTRYTDFGQERFFLALQPARANFRFVLNRLTNTADLTWMLTPTWAHVPIMQQACHGRDARVSVQALEDILTLKNQRPHLKAIHKSEGVSAPLTELGEEPFARIIDTTGLRIIGRTTYTNTLENRDTFDFIIDLTQQIHGQRYPAWIRRSDKIHRVELTHDEAGVLVRLIQASPRALSVRRLRSQQQLQRPDKIVEHARRKIDRQLQRRVWLFFHTITGESPDDKRYVFKPPEGTSWAVILPLNASQSSAAA